MDKKYIYDNVSSLTMNTFMVIITTKNDDNHNADDDCHEMLNMHRAYIHAYISCMRYLYNLYTNMIDINDTS
jgi:hypothetical protein